MSAAIAAKIRGSIIRRLDQFREAHPTLWCGFLDDAVGAAEVIANELDAAPRAEGVDLSALKSLPALWRQREDNGEEYTEFDKGYEQASNECADQLEAALTAAAPKVAAPQAEAGEVWQFLERFPEVNMANFNDDDVAALNQWGIEAYDRLRALAPQRSENGNG